MPATDNRFYVSPERRKILDEIQSLSARWDTLTTGEARHLMQLCDPIGQRLNYLGFTLEQESAIRSLAEGNAQPRDAIADELRTYAQQNHGRQPNDCRGVTVGGAPISNRAMRFDDCSFR